MAERVDLVAVEMRHRAGGAELQVAGDEHHADGIARLERAVVRHLARARSPAAALPMGRKPCSRKAPPSVSARSGSKPDITSGVAIGRSSVPS